MRLVKISDIPHQWTGQRLDSGDIVWLCVKCVCVHESSDDPSSLPPIGPCPMVKLCYGCQKANNLLMSDFEEKANSLLDKLEDIGLLRKTSNMAITCNNPYPPDYLDNYRLAIRQHDGPLAGDWEDKPRRLGYDLLNYAEYLEQVCKDQRKG